jgi:hypothetical protein
MKYGRLIAIVAVICLILFYSRSIISGIVWVSWEFIGGLVAIVGWIAHLIIQIALAVPGWALSAAGGILAALVPIAALGIVLVALWLGILMILRGFATLGTRLDVISAEGKQTALDSGFLAVLAAGSGAVAYLATDDFLDHFHTIKFMAVASLSCCIGKAAILTPARTSKLVGIVITLFAIMASGFYLANQYKRINWDQLDATRAFAFVMIVLLMGTAVGYPFSVRGWKRLLRSPG